MLTAYVHAVESGEKPILQHFLAMLTTDPQREQFLDLDRTARAAVAAARRGVSPLAALVAFTKARGSLPFVHVIGGAIASQGYGYYGPPGYYGPGYYDDGYYDQGVVAVAPGPVGADAVAYCMQTYRSYDPRSGTYPGYDGLRHPCP